MHSKSPKLTDYRKILFENYSKRVAELDLDDQSKIDWFFEYAKKAYSTFFESIDKESDILEIGCNKGYLLFVLNSWGFSNLTGIDLSIDDVAKAQHINPHSTLCVADAFDYLDIKQESFDVIIAKAVLEHVKKNQIFDFLKKIKIALKPGGMAIFDVPNMDWLFASHERYMDFTHEVGFTPHSLKQILLPFFSEVVVEPVDYTPFCNPINKERIKRKFARYVIEKLLTWAHPEGTLNPIWARCIVGVGKKT